MNPFWLPLPILLPLAWAALLLCLPAHRRRGAGLLAAASVALLGLSAGLAAQDGGVRAYLVADWPAPYGIVLVLDRLAGWMLALTAVVQLAAALWAAGGEDERGPHFHALLQLQWAGVAGAFLTADLFNLFVFFELLLAASYGLMLFGAGAAQLRPGLHYVVLNLAGSALFLLGAALLYAAAGTLNLADLAQRAATLPASARALGGAACALLAVVFLLKAAVAPLYLWLVRTYAAAPAAAAASFAVLSKLGVYALWRLLDTAAPLWYEPAWPLLRALGLITLVAAGLAMLASRRIADLAGWATCASSGLLLLVGVASEPALRAAALWYLPASAAAVASAFLLADWYRRGHGTALALCFLLCALALAGLPPAAGFPAKLWALQGLLAAPAAAWAWGGLLLGALFGVLALTSAGSALFWKAPARPGATLARSERAALTLLLALPPGLAFSAPWVQPAAQAAAEQALSGHDYVAAVLGARPHGAGRAHSTSDRVLRSDERAAP